MSSRRLSGPPPIDPSVIDQLALTPPPVSAVSPIHWPPREGEIASVVNYLMSPECRRLSANERTIAELIWFRRLSSAATAALLTSLGHVRLEVRQIGARRRRLERVTLAHLAVIRTGPTIASAWSHPALAAVEFLERLNGTPRARIRAVVRGLIDRLEPAPLAHRADVGRSTVIRFREAIHRAGAQSSANDSLVRFAGFIESTRHFGRHSERSLLTGRPTL